MHQPPHRYVTGPITPASIPKHSRWTCIRFHSGGNALDWCGVKHTAEKHADKHCLDPKGPAGHHPEEIHRIERYSDTELSYRGWTEPMMEQLLGEPDAQDLGTVHVYAYALYDADTVHAAERAPELDRLAAQAHNSGTLTIFEDDVTAILEAISTPLELELPFTDYSKLLKYAKKDIVRMTKEAALRYGKKYIPVKIGNEEGFAHAAARCSWRSHAANKFVYRVHHLSHQACDIVNSRLAHAALQILPEYEDVLSRFVEALDRIPAVGDPIPWQPSRRMPFPNEDGRPKLHNLTNLRWTQYDLSPAKAPPTPQWGPVTVTAKDGSIDPPYTATPPAPKTPGPPPATTSTRRPQQNPPKRSPREPAQQLSMLPA